MNVIPFPRQPPKERPITGKQLRAVLGVSQRWIRYRVSEGMPHGGLDYAGRRTFLLSEVEPWLEERQQRLGRSA